jgi:hypothetical protein
MAPCPRDGVLPPGQTVDDRWSVEPQGCTGSALPMTMSLAAVWRRTIELALSSPDAWPFEDRVLAWLLPNLQSDVARFHAGNGPTLSRVFRDFQLETIDRSLVQLLVARVVRLAPDLVQDPGEA